MTGGYVALLDVLGFSDLVAEDRDGAALRKYLGCLEDLAAQSEMNCVVFSDRIVLTVDGREAMKLLSLGQTCSRLLAELIDKDIPVRGAIACGDFFRTAVGSNVFVAGRAILDAYHYEQAQNWIGIMLAPSALKAVRDLNLDTRCSMGGFTTAFEELPDMAWAACIQRCNGIPFKNRPWHESPNQQGFAILPGCGQPDPPAIVAVLRNTISRLEWQQSVAPSPEAQRKYQATVSWLNSFLQPLMTMEREYEAWRARQSLPEA